MSNVLMPQNAHSTFLFPHARFESSGYLQLWFGGLCFEKILSFLVDVCPQFFRVVEAGI
jgi:hypothetical protein